jgi:hypothetical protein
LNESRFTYLVFGLTLRSNGPIPGLPLATRADAVADVHVHLNLSPLGTRILPSNAESLTYASPYQDESGNSMLRIWSLGGGKFCRLDYADGTRFWLDREGTEVWATWPENSTIEDTATYLLGPVLGRLLRLRGVTCLHASAVAFGEQAVAFVGPAGAGKSTTAAALALRGHAILSDDVVALAERDRSFYVHSAYPYLCLWPESVASIYGSADALPQLSANYDKRCLSLGKQELQFADHTLQLSAIYILGERRDDPAPIIEDLSSQQAFLSLLANTFGTNVVDGSMRAKEFETLGRLVPAVRIRQIWPHEDPNHLPELCQRICDDMQAIGSGRPALA